MDVSSHTKLDCEMHSCLRDTLRVSRWAGMFPVEGLNKTDIEELRCDQGIVKNKILQEDSEAKKETIKVTYMTLVFHEDLLRQSEAFNIKSFYTLYYLSTIIVQTIVTGLIIHWFFSNSLSLATLSVLVFYVTGLSSAILLLKLAWEWPRLIQRAASIEKRVTALRVQKIRAVRFNTVTYVVLITAAIEHSLSLIYKIKNVLLCGDVDYKSQTNFLEVYFIHMFPFVFKYIPINYFTISICSLANFQATFLWNFTDVMTMCFSMYLMSYFQDLNALVNSQKNKKTHDWEQLRIYYSKLVALVQAVDSKMCYLILLSILTNLFFICQQLYYTLNFGFILIVNCSNLQQEKRNIDKGINLFYFAYSFTFLVTRASIMFFLAANVNTAAMEPKYALSRVSYTDYDLCVQRFNRQLRYTTTALSGVFFYVTRKMILKVFATIVTYELVLLQFNN